jgi:hypothetical protein
VWNALILKLLFLLPVEAEHVGDPHRLCHRVEGNQQERVIGRPETVRRLAAGTFALQLNRTRVMNRHAQTSAEKESEQT